MASDRVNRALVALSSNECAFPGCTTPYVDVDTDTIVGEICHIEARSVGGPRYNPDAQIDDPSNLMVLCSVHHKIVDSQPDIFTVAVLTGMKRTHESAARPIDKDRIVGLLEALAPVTQPDWWRRDGAPDVRLTTTLSAHGEFNADVRFGQAVQEVSIRVGGVIQSDWYVPSPTAHARLAGAGYHVRGLNLTGLPSDAELEIDVRFWWQNGERHAIFRGPIGRIRKDRLPLVDRH